MRNTASVTFERLPDGRTRATFKNELTGETFAKVYSSEKVAQAQATRFFSKVNG